MSNQIQLCLWYDGQAKSAAEFYCSLFKNAQILSDTSLVVTFELNGLKLMGLNGGPMYRFNPSISLFVSCESIEQTNHLWDQLISGGKALMNIDTYPWSERYGWLQDRYGLTWQISVVNNSNDTPRIRPSFLFTGIQFGRAEAAINFYRSVFKDASTELIMHYPADGNNPGKLLYSEFTLNNQEFIAMDGPGVHEYTFNEAVSLLVNCETQDEIDYYWSKLTDGGRESNCGWLTDRFGISWQVVPTILAKLMTDPKRAGRVSQAFMKMKKFDIETLLKA